MSSFDLDRFVDAQSGVYARVVAELSVARKQSHWMWFVFPQIVGLGSSPMAQRYAIQSRAEAEAYLAHDLLGKRLVECTLLMVETEKRSVADILGHPDDLKFRSSMTLFRHVSRDTMFSDAIERFFPEGEDLSTIRILRLLE